MCGDEHDYRKEGSGDGGKKRYKVAVLIASVHEKLIAVVGTNQDACSDNQEYDPLSQISLPGRYGTRKCSKSSEYYPCAGEYIDEQPS